MTVLENKNRHLRVESGRCKVRFPTRNSVLRVRVSNNEMRIAAVRTHSLTQIMKLKSVKGKVPFDVKN
jgi:hypothetical protein